MIPQRTLEVETVQAYSVLQLDSSTKSSDMHLWNYLLMCHTVDLMSSTILHMQKTWIYIIYRLGTVFAQIDTAPRLVAAVKLMLHLTKSEAK